MDSPAELRGVYVVCHYLALGTVCISWPTSTQNRYFDVETWPKLFQGIYLVLGMQAYALLLALALLINLS